MPVHRWLDLRRLALRVSGILSLSVLFLVGVIPFAHSGFPDERQWYDSVFGYYASEGSIRDLFYDFSASVAVPVHLSVKVKGEISGSFPPARSEDLLNALAKLYDLTWFYDGSTVYINSIEEISQETFEVQLEQSSRIEKDLDGLEVRGTQYGWRMLAGQGLLQAVGPPRFLSLLDELSGYDSDSVDNVGSLPLDGDYTISIFELKYAYTSDNTSGQEGHIFGIANILAKIMNVQNVASPRSLQSHSGSSYDQGGALTNLLGTGLVKHQSDSTLAPQVQSADRSPAKPSLSGARPQAFIVADSRLNSLIIRDLKENMPIYEKLISKLDRPIDQIEINVIILDINENNVDELGVSWDLNEVWKRAVSLSSGLRDDIAFYDFGGAVAPARFAGIATLDGNFFAQLALLSRDQNARVLGQPSVVTFDNHEALFEHITTFYVELEGVASSQGQGVDLVPVNFGTKLKVTPHLVHEKDGTRKIQMSIRMEDGNNTGTAQQSSGGGYSTIQTQNSTLDTQALIEEGKSLLLGGYRLDQLTKANSGLPILRNLPIIGVLFGQDYDESVSAVRYFVITPKIIQAEVNYNEDIGEILENARRKNKALLGDVNRHILSESSEDDNVLSPPQHSEGSENFGSGGRTFK